ncbi:MAG: glycosyltransferase family 4 protein [Acidobacteriota bacterium]|nr:glycosyltransferase family 4 protein [Acidobacteriota bacterium]
MKLGINGWRIHGQRTGVGRYLLNIVKHWTPEMIGGQFDEINFYTPKPINRNEIPIPANIHERVLSPHWRMLVWENLRLGPVTDDDVVFHPSFSRPFVARGKTVVSLHDASHYLYPELFPKSVSLFYNRLYAWSGRHATLVIVGSEDSKKDIARYCGIPLSRIRVAYMAPAEFFKPVKKDSQLETVRERYIGSANTPFFLTVGKMSGRRNFPRLLEAFAEFKRRTLLPHKLLMVGLNIHNVDIAGLIKKLGIAGEVLNPGYISDDELNLIYNAAEAFISPSVYETICLPVMEAQAAGLPVICIDTPGMRETTGAAALLISKLEIEELAEAMSRMAEDADLRRELSETGLVYSKRFSWQKCAADVLAVLTEAAHMPAPTDFAASISEIKN